MTEPVRLTDSRRLTGANLHWQKPAAIIDCAGDSNLESFIERWEAAAKGFLARVGHSDEDTMVRRYHGGASLLISAPIDALYSMCELNEAAFALAAGESADDAETMQRLRAAFAQEANPPLLALQAAAARNGVPFLWDDDAVSVGYGATAQVWTPDKLPDPATLPWQDISDVPVAMVTGTNGKSTTVRMSAAILKAAGLRAGLTSTDWIRIGEEIIDTGDYSGTGGARTLLRDPRTEVAVLETARGGLLRRGLGAERVTAALITNIASDHLGEYGINTLAELIEAKFIVRRALFDGAPLILNADDPGAVDFAATLDQPLEWFSLDPDNPVVVRHRESGGRAAMLEDETLFLAEGAGKEALLAAADIPATLDGAARHNIANALAAASLCRALGVGSDAIRDGLSLFRGDEADNPGRGNWFEKDGVRILVDFAHNAHGMNALAEMMVRVPAERRLLLISQAGDRSDKDLYDMTSAACAMDPDHVLLCDLPGYERGRHPGEVAALIRASAIDCGVSKDAISHFPTPRDAVAGALEMAQPGDLLVLLVLTQRNEVLELLHGFLDD